MSTQADMKARIAAELRRDDLTTEIANAISSAIAFYQYDRFPTFNNGAVTAAPASDSEAGNPWMNVAEEMIRNRAKGIVYLGTIKEPNTAQLYLGYAKEWEQKLKTSTTFQTISSLTVGTRGYMKAKIANEIERGDLTTEIAAAIETAIDYYQSERFYFNERRDATFSTVANQFSYSSTDVPDIGRLVSIDYLFAYIGGQPFRLSALPADEMEWAHLATNDPVGQPFRYDYYAQTLQIYPTPDQAYTIRFGGQFSVDSPTNDTVTGNAWMTIAEPIIRARAKFELYAHIPAIMDANKAMAMKQLADDQYNQMKERTSDMTRTADFIIEPWGY